MNELLKSGLIAAGFTLLICLIFIITYWAFRGFLPGSKVVEMPLPAPNDLDGITAKFKLFYVNWCPYSKKAYEVVEQLKGVVEQHTYGGKHVKIEFIDCETKRDECSLFKIDSYPTYKLETSIKMYEYLGPSDIQAYTQFLVSALGKEEPIN